MNNLASPWHRLIAFLVDASLRLTLVLFLFQYTVSESSIPQIISRAIQSILILILSSFAISLFINNLLTVFWGGSLGKIVTGLKVVTNPDEKPLSFWRAVFRHNIGYFVSSVFIGLGYLWVAIDKNRQGWHDQIAGTKVLVTRSWGIFLASVFLAILVILNISLLSSSFQQITTHQPVYTEAVSTLQQNVKDLFHK